MSHIDQSIRILQIMAKTNQVKPEDVPGFLEGVHQSLVAMAGKESGAPAAAAEAAPAPTEEAPEKKPAKAAPEAPKPAVSIRASVKEDSVTCMACGKVAKVLKRHIGTAHGMDEKEYRKTFGLPKDHPLVAPSYSRKRSQQAKDLGLGEKMLKARTAKKKKK